MANPEHLAILMQGVEVWNRWRQEQRKSHGKERLDLRGAELRSADLVKVDFGGSYTLLPAAEACVSSMLTFAELTCPRLSSWGLITEG